MLIFHKISKIIIKLKLGKNEITIKLSCCITAIFIALLLL